MKLYSRESSGNSYKARLLLGFLALPYEKIEIERGGDGRNALPADYLSLNPRGQIPTLVDGDVVLWGSTAILYYLALTHDGQRRWMPAGARAGAEVMQWMELAQNEILSGLAIARGIIRWGFKEDLAACQAKGLKALAVMEARLSRHEWLAGAQPTIAECACFPYTALAPEGQIDLGPYPGVRGWLGRIKRLPGFITMPGLSIGEA